MNRALVASIVTAAALAVVLFVEVMASQPLGCPSAPEGLPMPDDIPLMTEQEKEWARESGVGSYRIGSTYYVDWSLPASYWEE